MNTRTVEYYTSGVRAGSEQCRDVRRELLADAAEDHARLRAVRPLLDGRAPLERDTLSWLTRAICGHYGGEGYALDVGSNDEAGFWTNLQRR